jgi:hypothetical protein
MIKKLMKGALEQLGYTVVKSRWRYCDDGLSTLHQPRFRSSPRFEDAYRRGVDASHGVDPRFEWRVHTALWSASRALDVEGDFIECGVNAGFVSSAILQYVKWEDPDKKFYLIDTFCGPDLSQYSQIEIEAGRARIAEAALSSGSYVTDMDRIRANYSKWPQAVIVQGMIPQILPSLDVGTVAFAHIDLNCAGPEVAALEYVWPRLSKGGFVLLDDYAYAGCFHQGDMLDRAADGLGAEILAMPTGQGLMMK